MEANETERRNALDADTLHRAADVLTERGNTTFANLVRQIAQNIETTGTTPPDALTGDGASRARA